MKVLLEFCFIILLIGVGWRQPYREHLERAFGPSGITGTRTDDRSSRNVSPTPLPIGPRATPAPDTRWMWKNSTLDR